jgi:hypothetical protein
MRARPVLTYLASSRVFPAAGVGRRCVQTCAVTVVASSDHNGTNRKPNDFVSLAVIGPLPQGGGARRLALIHIGQFDAACPESEKLLPGALTIGADLSRAWTVQQTGQSSQSVRVPSNTIDSTKAGANPRAGAIASSAVSPVMLIHTAA